MRRKARNGTGVAAVLAGVVLLLGGCAGLPAGGPEQADKVFLIERLPEPIPRGEPTCATLVISPTASAAGYATSSMAYTQQAFQLEYFAQHRWADSPAAMITPLLVQMFSAGEVFDGVLLAPTPADAEVRLDTKVLELRQVFDGAAAPSEVRATLQVSLVGVASGRLLGSTVLRVSEPAERNPVAGATAANQAVAELLRELAGFVYRRVNEAGVECR